MIIESRTIVGAAGAFAVVGAAVWFSLSAGTSTTAAHTGSVQVEQIEERSWAVEVKDLGSGLSNDSVKTAANR